MEKKKCQNAELLQTDSRLVQTHRQDSLLAAGVCQLRSTNIFTTAGPLGENSAYNSLFSFCWSRGVND